MELEMIEDYKGCTLIPKTNVGYPGVVYGEIRSNNGGLLVSATLDYCVEKLKKIAELREKHGLTGRF